MRLQLPTPSVSFWTYLSFVKGALPYAKEMLEKQALEKEGAAAAAASSAAEGNAPPETKKTQ